MEATYFLRLGGEKRVKEVFPGKTTSKQRAEGSVGVNEVRTLEAQVLKISNRKREEQELEGAKTGEVRRQTSPCLRERPCTHKSLSDLEQYRGCLIEHQVYWRPKESITQLFLPIYF